MPFHNSVYYPYPPDPRGTHSSADIPSLLNSPRSQPSSGSLCGPPQAAMSCSTTPTSAAAAVPPFKFRTRRESVDWRRISAVDVDQVASELDFHTLQEHVAGVTFCNVEGERCARCQSPVDPALLKLFRLAQLTVEYLLHSQEYLTLSLQAAEERQAAGLRERQALLAQQQKRAEEIQGLKTELKQRKRAIKHSQQTILATGLANCQKCQHCDKAFMNSSFLQNHVQRRHPAEYEAQFRSDSEKQSQIDVLRLEIGHLKEKLSQQQESVSAKSSKEKEQQSMYEDLMKKLGQWQAEETERMNRKLEDSRDNIRREMEMIYSRNLLMHHQSASREAAPSPVQPRQAERDLDAYKEIHMQAVQKLEQQLRMQDKKWESKMFEIQSQHELEKNQLLNEMSQMQSSVSEQRERSQKFRQDIVLTLQEKEHTILAQRDQIESMASSHTTNVLEVPVIYTAPVPEPKPKKVACEQPPPAPKLDPIEELSEEDKDSNSVSEKKPASKQGGKRQQPLASSILKQNPGIKKELRPALEQALTDKLEDLGVKPGLGGLKERDYSAILAMVLAQRDSVARRTPGYWHHRDEVTQRLEQKLRGRRGSEPALRPRSKARKAAQGVHEVTESRPRSSSLPSRVTQVACGPAPAKQPRTPQPAQRVKTATVVKTSTPKPAAKRISTPKTPPFSSDQDSDEEESEEEEEEQAPKHRRQEPQRGVQRRSPQAKESQARPNLGKQEIARPIRTSPVQSRPVPVQRQAALNRATIGAVESDGEWTDDASELEEIDLGGASGYRVQNDNVQRRNNNNNNTVKDLTKSLERKLADRGGKKPAGGVSTVPESTDVVRELKYTKVDDDSEDWDISSLEDVPEPDRAKPAQGSGPLRKSLDSSSTSVWGTSTGKGPAGLRESGTGSTLKSSLASVSDLTDSD